MASSEICAIEAPVAVADSMAQRRRWLGLSVLLAGSFMTVLDAMIVQLALPSIARDLGAGSAAIELIIAGYSLAYGVLLVTGGRLGDMFGRKRIYLTGLSCGAIGSWSYLDKYKDKVVAASLLISGDPGNIYNDDGCALVSDLSLWSVHGSVDPTVSPADDEATMPKFIACPSPRADVKWNLIDGGAHDVWTKTYDLSYGLGDVYQWMLDHPKK